ncbi:MAG: SdpI family protein [Candidatus Bathyarchaeota archaeon]|nr:SdpI family protein [Candidatus Bathyarchaeota archaeon]
MRNIAPLLVILLQFLVSIYFYPQMPEQIAMHWNVHGVVDGYSPKLWGLFLLPFISIGLLLLFLAIPGIDPLKNIERFGKYYWGLVILLLVFMLYLNSVVISWNLGFKFGMFQVLAPAIGILFYYIGVVTENAKRNWFVGIRTPWTLSNERVWDNTHKLGGKLFKICGALAVFGIVSEWLGLLLMIAPILCIVVYLTVYSYFEYRKQTSAL